LEAGEEAIMFPVVSTVKPGKELSPEEIAGCVAVLKEGKAVYLESAEGELPVAVAVALCGDEQGIFGVGAVKRPRPPYAKSTAEKSAFDFDPNMHELGYIAVLKSHQNQGHGGKILNALLNAFNGPLWATTFNPLMKSSLGKLRIPSSRERVAQKARRRTTISLDQRNVSPRLTSFCQVSYCTNLVRARPASTQIDSAPARVDEPIG